MSMGQRGNRRTKVLEFRDAETTAYAILSHRWIDPTEVDCEEIINLAKMDVEEQNEIRGRLGYKKILDTCEQAKRDGYKWVWVDTCCIDTRSSAELSEAINSMYRWYENSRVCYAYLGDVHTSSFPTLCNEAEYPRSNGWPEWFSRGWTLQEMIAPQDVRFFNKNWQSIGDKKTLARTLMLITEVPEHILEKGISGNRPCVAQIMSWAAHRTTTRIEDRAYSLMGLLDVNMPMLYGEGKKAFHRLQLEIIRMSNDQSIFVWGTGRDKENFGQTGSVLADDPSLFQDCSYIEPMDHNEFIESIGNHVPRGDLVSVDQDCFGTFPITNRGIQIWMLLRPHRSTDSVFQAWLPCRDGSSGPPVTISLALWNSNYYRYSSTGFLPTEQPLEFRQVYLRYQDTCHGITFEIDDNAVTEHFTCCDTYPSKFTGKMLTLTGASRPCVKVYSERQGSGRFAVSFGQCFGQDWLHLINDPSWQYSWPDEGKLMLRGLERAQSMADTPSRAELYGHIWVHHIRLPGTTWMARASRIVWEKSRVGLRIEVFQKRGSYSGLDEWRMLDVEVGVFSLCAHALLPHTFTENR